MKYEYEIFAFAPEELSTTNIHEILSERANEYINIIRAKAKTEVQTEMLFEGN